MTNRRRNRRRRGTSVRVLMRHALRGVTLRVNPDPPSIVVNPWNTATISVGQTGDIDVTVKGFWAVLCSQLGLQFNSGGVTYNMSGYVRFQKVRVWGLTKARAITVSVFEPSADLLWTGSDWPSANHLPAVGYIWPNRVQMDVHYSDSDSKIFSVDVGGTSGWVAFVDILWRGLPSKVTVSDSVRSRPLLSGADTFDLCAELTSVLVLD